MLADVGFEPGGVDDEVGAQLERHPVLGANLGDDLAVVPGPHVGDLTLVGAVEALAATPVELAEPQLAVRRVRAAEHVVVRLALLALELEELLARLPAPRRLRPVEPLVRPPVPAPAAQEPGRPLRPIDV